MLASKQTYSTPTPTQNVMVFHSSPASASGGPKGWSIAMLSMCITFPSRRANPTESNDASPPAEIRGIELLLSSKGTISARSVKKPQHTFNMVVVSASVCFELGRVDDRLQRQRLRDTFS